MLKFKKIRGNLIHETAVINWKKLDIGKNNIIGPYVVIGIAGSSSLIGRCRGSP